MQYPNWFYNEKRIIKRLCCISETSISVALMNLTISFNLFSFGSEEFTQQCPTFF